MCIGKELMREGRNVAAHPLFFSSIRFSSNVIAPKSLPGAEGLFTQASRRHDTADCKIIARSRLFATKHSSLCLSLSPSASLSMSLSLPLPLPDSYVVKRWEVGSPLLEDQSESLPFLPPPPLLPAADMVE